MKAKALNLLDLNFEILQDSILNEGIFSINSDEITGKQSEEKQEKNLLLMSEVS